MYGEQSYEAMRGMELNVTLVSFTNLKHEVSTEVEDAIRKWVVGVR